MKGIFITVVIALILDIVFKDPGQDYHPVALIGRYIAFIEKKLYPKKPAKKALILRGGLLVGLTLLPVSFIAFIYQHFTQKLPFLFQVVFQGVGLFFAIAPTGLAFSVNTIKNHLKDGNLAEARKSLGMIVSRDTRELPVTEVVRGSLESLAENTGDGVVAPIFWYLIGGLPGVWFYRTVNTLDSMVGYKSERYLYFGRIAAKLDDLLNYLPARITGVLMVLAAFILRYDWKKAIKTWLRDARKHPSPNGGIPESVLAGCLGVRLGGENIYHGQKSFRAYLGEPLNPLTPEVIDRALKLFWLTVILMVLLFGGLFAVGGV
ncbi:adenosylcobinamide-phosphate synthase CbiB [Carboxydothermus ferrireducens]|uniref:Cobalamin biosynthesis protein CobD n=1 Tax=Carboxydothermus ferrireducens DSM 11255 TaxID=1119529 RepID=A0ABX2R6R5_9THEO|nr:adenosylcobinamide-phosphate synthase CbiB [Carboxydothermus ferrireducens]NYE56649.1 adenosylcobinamide-phosphate synthase [Carboxydothermus ferrireducens DSM 11255]